MIAALLAALAMQAAPSIEGEWRISRGVMAPWVEDGQHAQFDANARLGQRIVYRADRVEGPDVLACGNARYEAGEQPFEGLFQGNLPEPANDAAGFGLVKAPVATVSVTCDTGIFDLHFATPDAAWLGLDNVAWLLDRSPGALAADGTPERATQSLLQDHYAHGLEFTAARMQAQRAHFTDALGGKIDAYFAQDFPADEVPPIDGDPFTDSQEYPPVFSVREAKIVGDAATVPVRFDNGHDTREVSYRLRREHGAWKLDDIVYAHGDFSGLLASKP